MCSLHLQSAYSAPTTICLLIVRGRRHAERASLVFLRNPTRVLSNPSLYKHRNPHRPARPEGVPGSSLDESHLIPIHISSSEAIE